MLSWVAGLPTRLARVTMSTTYVPQIDGLRFLAIMPVLFFHAGLRGQRFYASPSDAENLVAAWLPHGALGVSLFFFISGYIIAYPFLAGNKPSLRKFFLRRLTRLEPPYFLVMLGCFLVLAIGFAPQNTHVYETSQIPIGQSLLASLTYSHGVLFGESPRLNPPVWSLEREVQFYLLAPLILAVYRSIRDRRRRLVFCAVASAALLLLGEFLVFNEHPKSFIRWTLLAESYGFMLGIGACDYSIGCNLFARPSRKAFDVGFVVGAIGILFSGALEHASYEGYELSFGGMLANTCLRAACIVALFLAAARGTWSKRFLSLPWVTLIGGACYSIYLVHVPVIQFGAQMLSRFISYGSLAESWLISWLLFIPLSLVFGLTFYALIERPCMDPRWPQKLWRYLTSSLTIERSRRSASKGGVASALDEDDVASSLER